MFGRRAGATDIILMKLPLTVSSLRKCPAYRIFLRLVELALPYAVCMSVLHRPFLFINLSSVHSVVNGPPKRKIEPMMWLLSLLGKDII